MWTPDGDERHETLLASGRCQDQAQCAINRSPSPHREHYQISDGNDGFATPALTIDSSENITAHGTFAVSGQAVTGAGALTLGKTYHSLSNSSGSTYAVTLAAPTAAEDGIVKAIKMIAGDGTNTVTLALTNVAGGSAATTATFDAAGETLIVQAAGGKWIVLKEFGVTLS
jgi:hypothetical protein